MSKVQQAGEHRMKCVAAAMALVLAAPALGYGQDFTPREVVVQETGAGRYFTNTSGMTLYVYARDTIPRKSTCNDRCAKVWPPLTATGDQQPAGKWAVVVRDDGSNQWAYNGRPLYAYVKDTGPGQTIGEAFDNSWYVAFQPIMTPAEIVIRGTVLGRVLADVNGTTLYVFDGDKRPGKSMCNDQCLYDWQPLGAPAISKSSGDWSVAVRDDGKRQWAFQGKPLYTYKVELRPGSTAGDGLGGAWHAALLEPILPMPSWITVQASDVGPVLADAKAMTLYSTPTQGSWNFDKMLKETCKKECMEKFWQPVILRPDETLPKSNWSAITLADGTRQLTYKGDPVYTFANDKKPGDVLRGEHFGSGLIQSAGFQSILQSSLVRVSR